MAEEEGAVYGDRRSKGVDTEVLVASYIKDNTSQGKGWIFDSGVWFMYVPRKSCSITT